MAEKEIGYDKTICDVVGLGAGVVDTLHAQGHMIYPFNSAEKAEEPITEGIINGRTSSFLSTFQYKNKRAEAYWNLRTLFESSTIKVIDDQDLIRELVNMRYINKDRVIAIESKEDIKKRLGYSPDRADATAMVFYLKQFVGEVSTGKNVFNAEKQNNNTKLMDQWRRYRV
jgi:hypothetical protein